jgi:ketosteroid isomerase-like protein
MTKKEIILKLLALEVVGDHSSAFDLLSDKYVMSWVYKSKSIFPSVKVDKNFNNKLAEAYSFPDRKYEIYSMIQEGDFVAAEIVESYFDNQTNILYKTPISFVWEFDDNNLVLSGKHYCDPDISSEMITAEQLFGLYKKEPIIVIDKNSASGFLSVEKN